MKKFLSLQLPFYCTRPDGNGYIGSFWMNAAFMLLCFIIAWINFLVWGIVGLIVAFRVVF